ncbi:Hypothetical protein PBC10988_24070 [Planctomycetales bacterium 10988]|nr:Hypothetical protein PBC10988_24070 [Planctomycetales bacterium 10988]
MVKLPLFPLHHERRQQSQLHQLKDTPLLLEQLEGRQLLAADPMMIEIVPGPGVSNPNYFAELDGTAYFQANGGSAGIELWMSNGTSAGTMLVKDINPSGNSSPSFLVNMDGTLFFQANDGSSGAELWMSDGTSGGTVLLKDINPSGSSNPSNLTEVDGTLFFTAENGSTGAELWMSDGTAGGTMLVKNINGLAVGSNVDFLTNVNGTLFFQANDGSVGSELWMSDGTSGGTSLVKDIRAGTSSGGAQYLENLDGTLFFHANDGSVGRELWMSDGTSAGTSLVKDIRPGSSSSFPAFLENVDGTLYFSANGGTYSTELWKSDGTSAGTTLVKDINPGTSFSAPAYLTNVAGTLFFRANDGSVGGELWTSDGTSAGTMLVKDIRPGSLSSFTRYLADINGTLFFNATDGSAGFELWLLNTEAPTLEITPDGIVTNDDPILFTFQFSEEVVGFDASDIMVDNGSAGTFMMIDGDTYTLEVSPLEDGEVTVTVMDAVAQDVTGNDNVGDEATVIYDEDLLEEMPLIVTGTDAGSAATVRIFDGNGNELDSFFPYTEAFTGGVRVATGDINNDGILDIVTAAGPGGGPHIQVFDSQTGELITGGTNNFYAYDPLFSGGVFIAVGDVNNDGFDDIITGADAGGGPHVKVFDGESGAVISEFYAYDIDFNGGVRVAAGDIDGNDTAEVITAPGVGGGPRVRVFDGTNSTGVPLEGPATDFLAYDMNFTGGIYVAAGDVDNDGLDDIITGAGQTGGPHVKVFNSLDASLLQNFYAYDPSFTGGVRVGSVDINGDDFADILTVPGSPGGPHTRAFSGVDASDLSNFYSGMPMNFDGLYVAGGITLAPIEGTSGPSSAPLSSQFATTSEDSSEDANLELNTSKQSWFDDTEEFFQSAEEIDKLFSGLGIR